MHNPEQILDRIEQQFNAAATHVIDGDAQALAVACEALQSLSVELSQLLARTRKIPKDRQLLLRIKSLAQGLQVVRDNLSRRSAFVEQSVAILFPRRSGPTYSANGAGVGRGLQRPRGFSG